MAAPGLLGVLALPVYGWQLGVTRLDLVLFLVFYLATQGLGLSVGFHRHFSHRAFEASKPVRAALAILGSMAAQGSVTYWAAVHRRHHEKTDVEGDPHSPRPSGDGPFAKLRGLWHGHFGWTLGYGLPNAMHYCPDLVRERWLQTINRCYRELVLLGLVLPAVVGGLLGGWHGAVGGLVLAGGVRVFVGSNSTWCLNSLCHVFGARPFETRDGSTNVWWLALPTLGESWHNNHHAYPASARHGFRWRELDVNYAMIRGLELLGLVTKVKRPPGEAVHR